jgi:type VI protein secretion system component VasK
MEAERWVGFNDGNLAYMSRVKELAPKVPVFWDRGPTSIEKDIQIAQKHGFEAMVLHFATITPAKVNKIRSIYFPSGGPVPEFSFSLTPEYLDAGATRFAMEVDGQSFEYRHGPQRSTSMKWPGQGAGQAAATLDTQNGASPNQVFSGPWALFRLLDSARIQPRTDTRFLLSFAIGGSSARVLLDAATIRNPLRENVLQGFSCGR